MTSNTKNWLLELAEAGACTVDTPKILHFGDERAEVYLGFLPFMTDKEKFKQEAAELAKDIIDWPRSQPALLFFHEELRGVKYNLSTKSDTAPVVVKDLHPEKYMFCIGGHMHLQQMMGNNVWYAGSPFAVDW